MAAIQTTIEFTYEPADLFEEPTPVPVRHGQLTFDAGKALYVLTVPTEPVPDSTMTEVENEVSSALRVREILTHRASSLSTPTAKHNQASGGQSVAITPRSVSTTVVGGRPDVVIKEAGKVVHDTRAARIKADSDFLASVSPKTGNPTVAKMLKSYAAAIRDPAKELSHLFEIVEAAEEICRGRSEAYGGLGFKKSEWDAITRLANDPQINQGRHTGKAIHSTRDVTETEIEKARQLARDIVRRYAAKVQ